MATARIWRQALRGIPEGAATILLAHNPRLVTAAACRGISLVLSGHTHGGQVNVPLLGTVYGRSPEQMRFKKGWDRLGGTQIYVSRGIGTIVLPVRWRCPAEVPLLELEPHQRDDITALCGAVRNSLEGVLVWPWPAIDRAVPPAVCSL